MTFLFNVEDAFEIAGRGCVIVPAITDGTDFKIRPGDAIQLRTPEERTLNTEIVSVEFLKPALGSVCRMAILLPGTVRREDVPKGTEVFLGQSS